MESLRKADKSIFDRNPFFLSKKSFKLLPYHKAGVASQEEKPHKVSLLIWSRKVHYGGHDKVDILSEPDCIRNDAQKILRL